MIDYMRTYTKVPQFDHQQVVEKPNFILETYFPFFTGNIENLEVEMKVLYRLKWLNYGGFYAVEQKTEQKGY